MSEEAEPYGTATYRGRSELEWRLLNRIEHAGLPMPTPEHRFAPPRRWRFDFAWVEQWVAVEVEGGTWTSGRHVRGAGYDNDCEKYDEAVLMGWRILRFTAHHIDCGYAIETLKRALL